MSTSKSMHKNEVGQTLLELVIAIGIVVIIVMGLIVAITSSLRYGQDSRLRSDAVKYAQEGIELSRKIRDVKGWSSFVSYSGTGTETWCVDVNGTFTAQTGSCPLIRSVYQRTVSFSWNAPLMTVISTVSWAQGSTTANTSVETYFSNWK